MGGVVYKLGGPVDLVLSVVNRTVLDSCLYSCVLLS